MSEAVYALIDPRDERPFYIGRSKDPKRRLIEHMKDRIHSDKNTRICEIKDDGGVPIMLVLGWYEDGVAAERHWIKTVHQLGFDLTNKSARYRTMMAKRNFMAAFAVGDGRLEIRYKVT